MVAQIGILLELGKSVAEVAQDLEVNCEEFDFGGKVAETRFWRS